MNMKISLPIHNVNLFGFENKYNYMLLNMQIRPMVLICFFGVAAGYLAYVLGGQTVTSRSLHCTRLLGLWIYDQQGHLTYMLGDWARASIVYIVSLYPLTSSAWVSACLQAPYPPKSPLLKKRPCVKSCLVRGMDKYKANKIMEIVT